MVWRPLLWGLAVDDSRLHPAAATLVLGSGWPSVQQVCPAAGPPLSRLFDGLLGGRAVPERRGRPADRRPDRRSEHGATIAFLRPSLGAEHCVHHLDVLGGPATQRRGFGSRSQEIVGAVRGDRAHPVLWHARGRRWPPRLPQVCPAGGEQVHRDCEANVTRRRRAAASIALAAALLTVVSACSIP